MRPHFLEPVLSSQVAWGLRIAGTGTWLARTAELAGTSQARRRGLQGRDDLDDDSALVIAPTQGIHTFGMRFALDVVGVRRNGEVVSVKDNVGSRRVVLSLRAFAIVELRGGTCARVGLAGGDRLVAELHDIAVAPSLSGSRMSLM